MTNLLPILIVYGTGLALAILVGLAALRLVNKPHRYTRSFAIVEYASVELRVETRWYRRAWYLVSNPVRYLFTGKWRL